MAAVNVLNARFGNAALQLKIGPVLRGEGQQSRMVALGLNRAPTCLKQWHETHMSTYICTRGLVLEMLC